MEGKLEKRLVDLYLANRDILEEGLPRVLNRHRSAAIEQFNLQGIPPRGTGNGDRYHYTDLRKVFDAEYEHYFTPSYRGVPTGGEDAAEGYAVNVLNGFCRGKGLEVSEEGVVFGSLAAASEAAVYGEIVGKYYNTACDMETDPAAALNTAFVQDGAFVYIPENVKQEAPVTVNMAHYAQGESVADFGRVLLVAEKNSEVRVVLASKTLSGEKFLSCITVEIFAEEGSRVEFVEVDDSNAGSAAVSSIFAHQEVGSELGTLSVALNGGLVRGNRTVKLMGRNAENRTYGLYVCGPEEHIDFMTDIRHEAEGCTSSEHFKGIAANGGTGVFSGRIYVAPAAVKTQAFQQNHNLLLGNEAHIYTKPQLEIYADDVKCSHGATVGQLDENALYYMRQRGISETDARKLQMSGFVNDIIGKTRIPGLAERLSLLVEKKIEKM